MEYIFQIIGAILLAIEYQAKIKKFEVWLAGVIPFENLIKLKLPTIIWKALRNKTSAFLDKKFKWLDTHDFITAMITVSIGLLTFLGILAGLKYLADFLGIYAPFIKPIPIWVLKALNYFFFLGENLFVWLSQKLGFLAIILLPFLPLISHITGIVCAFLGTLVFMFSALFFLYMLLVVLYILTFFITTLLIPCVAAIIFIKEKFGMKYHIKAIGLILIVLGIIINWLK